MNNFDNIYQSYGKELGKSNFHYQYVIMYRHTFAVILYEEMVVNNWFVQMVMKLVHIDLIRRLVYYVSLPYIRKDLCQKQIYIQDCSFLHFG